MGNLNNHLGVPLTLTRIDPTEHQFAVIEAGDDIDLAFDGVKDATREIADKVNVFRSAITALVAQNAELGGDDVHSKSLHMRDNVLPAMNAVREAADALEVLVAKDLWPLPSYQEILFEK